MQTGLCDIWLKTSRQAFSKCSYISTAPEIGPFNSPKIGPRSIATISVTAAEASGEIGFASVEPMVVQEPAGGPSTVRLKLSREGTSGQAVVSWLMTGTGGTVTSADTGPTQGTVTMLSGKIFLLDKNHYLQWKIIQILSSLT